MVYYKRKRLIGVMIKNKNIAIVGNFIPWECGGTATHSTEIAKILSKRNRVICVTTSSHREELHNGNLTEKVEKHGKTLQKLKRCFLLRKDIDIFHMQDLRYGLYRFVDNKTPLVITCHGYPTLEAVANGRIKPDSIQFKLLRWIEKKAVKRADAVIVVDSTLKNFVINTLNAEKEKVFCIPNGVDVDEFSPIVNSDNLRKKYIKDDEKLIVCIRRFVPKNGVFIVLEAMNLLVNEKKEKKAKLILGGGGPLENDFKKYIKEKKLQDYITILGSIPHKEMPEYFAAADIIVNTFTHIPYVKEQEVSSMLEALDNGHPIGTSITTVEALAAGKCTIVCTVGGKYIKIHPSDPGILLSDKNSNLLAAILYKLIGDDELRTKIGRNGREYVVLKRSWKAVVKEVEKVYSFVLGGSS
jgi:glycosyltransferase involved in cell wall biosynthesis